MHTKRQQNESEKGQENESDQKSNQRQEEMTIHDMQKAKWKQEKSKNIKTKRKGLFTSTENRSESEKDQKLSDRCRTRGESEESVVHRRGSKQARKSTLKPKADVTRSPK